MFLRKRYTLHHDRKFHYHVQISVPQELWLENWRTNCLDTNSAENKLSFCGLKFFTRKLVPLLWEVKLTSDRTHKNAHNKRSKTKNISLGEVDCLYRKCYKQQLTNIINNKYSHTIEVNYHRVVKRSLSLKFEHPLLKSLIEIL